MRILAIAHRGASKYKPENTLEAFELAADLGADMVEFDVRRNQTGEFVVAHNKPSEHGAQYCTLSSVLETLRDRIRFNIELKEPGYEREVIEFILSRVRPEQIIVSSFLPDVVRTVKSDFPGVQAGLILGPEGWRNIVRMLAFVLSPKSSIEIGDFLVLHKSLYNLNPLDKFAWFAKPVYVWTVDGEKMMKKIVRDGNVSGIISNKPDICKKIIMENLQ